jgi:hypothetical protein
MSRPTLFLILAATLAVPPAATAQGSPPIDIPERIAGADRAVVARIQRVTARLERNEWGDELIVTHARLTVEEALKGDLPETLTVAVEGGTLGDLTLRVSDLPVLRAGERAVFLLREDRGRMVPHLRGLGILKLDETDTVRGSGLTLGTIRSMAQQAGRR